jgi:hypothetical protein
MKSLGLLLVALVAAAGFWALYTINALERENAGLRDCSRGCSPCERYLP